MVDSYVNQKAPSGAIRFSRCKPVASHDAVGSVSDHRDGNGRVEFG